MRRGVFEREGDRYRHRGREQELVGQTEQGPKARCSERVLVQSRG